MGGLSPGKRCSQFGDFVDTTKLHDLGFKGPLLLGIEVVSLRDWIAYYGMRNGSKVS